MDLSKSLEYFNPANADKRVRIIGCGSIGSTIATMFARLGMNSFALYDFDVVSAHNIANQAFTSKDIKRTKVEALAEMILDINPLADVEINDKGWTPGTKLSGYVILAVDNIETRRQICEENLLNNSIKLVMDFRTGLEDAQHFACDWSDMSERKRLIKTMEFSQEDGLKTTPVSACGIILGVYPTVASICSFGAANFVNWVNGKELKRFILVNPFYNNVIDE